MRPLLCFPWFAYWSPDFCLWASLYFSEYRRRPPPQPLSPPPSSSIMLCLRATCKSFRFSFWRLFLKQNLLTGYFWQFGFFLLSTKVWIHWIFRFFCPCLFSVTDPSGCKWPSSIQSTSFLATKVLSSAWERWDTCLLALRKIEGRFPFN